MLPSVAFDGRRDGPYVVLLNALGTTNPAWDPVVGSLAKDFGVVRIDLPGHGVSPVPDGPPSMSGLADQVRAVLERLSITRASVAGCSLGGMIAQQLAHENDGLVENLVLIGTQARAATPEYWTQRVADAQKQGLARVADVAVPRWFSQGFIERDSDGVSRVRGMLVSSDLRGYVACMEAISGFDARPWLADISFPTLVVCGDSDSTMTVETFTQFASLFRDARLEILPGVGHLAHVEQPDEVARLIREFIAAGGAR